MDAVAESISKMIPEGNVLKLPTDCIFKNYAAVKKALVKAEGKYKKNTFIFPSDAAEIQTRLVGGEKIDDKKQFQFFATPKELAMKLVEMSGLERGQKWLEPSAGTGAIADIMREISPNDGMVIELMPRNCNDLMHKGYSPIQHDFLDIAMPNLFDVIVANPPFSKNQDIAHVMRMITMLRPGGRLVSIMSNSWTFGSQKKHVDFRIMLNDIGGEQYAIGSGAFKESGTGVATTIVVIDKPDE